MQRFTPGQVLYIEATAARPRPAPMPASRVIFDERKLAELIVKMTADELQARRVSTYDNGPSSNAPLSGGLFERRSEYELTSEQRAAIDAGRARAMSDMGLPWFDVVAYVPLAIGADGVPAEDERSTCAGQMRPGAPSSVWVRVREPRKMLHTILHEARHVYQARENRDFAAAYYLDPVKYENDASAYADEALAHVLSYPHNARLR